jgi:hypothetical protein
MKFAELMTSISELDVAHTVELPVTVGQLREAEHLIRLGEARIRALVRIIEATRDTSIDAVTHAHIIKDAAGL